MVDNIGEKEGKTAFSPFPTMYVKALFLCLLKVGMSSKE